MTITVAITDRVNELIEKRWKEVTRQVGWIQKEGFINSLLLLALTDEALSRQAAYLSHHYFDGKGATALEYKEES